MTTISHQVGHDWVTFNNWSNGNLISWPFFLVFDSPPPQNELIYVYLRDLVHPDIVKLWGHCQLVGSVENITHRPLHIWLACDKPGRELVKQIRIDLPLLWFPPTGTNPNVTKENVMERNNLIALNQVDVARVSSLNWSNLQSKASIDLLNMVFMGLCQLGCTYCHHSPVLLQICRESRRKKRRQWSSRYRWYGPICGPYSGPAAEPYRQ